MPAPDPGKRRETALAACTAPRFRHTHGAARTAPGYSARMRPTTRLQAALYVFVGALAFYWITMNVVGRGFGPWYRLARTGVATTATITAVDPSQHGRCDFRYEVDGRTLNGRDSGCAKLGVGATLAIAYLPSDPDFATSRDPVDELEFEIFGPLVLSFIGAGIAAARFRGKESPRA